jgi:PAS domain S-box-containing protein
MDIQIKGELDGIETVAALRGRDIPIIYMSGHTDSKTIDRAKVSGASGFLTKPIQHNTLGISIEMALHKHQTDRVVRNRLPWTEERFQLIVEAAPNALIMVAANGLIALVNTQTEKLFGYDRRELLGLSLDMLVPERFRSIHGGHRNAFFVAPAARAMGANPDLFGLRRDGTEVPVEIGLNPIVTSDGQFVLASIIDITERRQASQERERLIDSLKIALNEKTVIPKSFDWQNPKSLGLRIVRILTRQIDGDLTLDHSGGGTRFELRFPEATAGPG